VFVGPFTTDESLSIEDSIFRVGSELILGGVTNQTLTLGRESDIGRSDSITLVVSDDFNSAVFEDADTRIGGA